MNLAEIRKKAQKQKEIIEDVSAPELLPPFERIIDDDFVPGDLSLEEPAPELVEETPVFEPESPAHRFDPLAVLLAGRAAAGAVVETAAAPDSEASADVDGSQKYLCFRVAAEEYAISLMDIKEIIKPRQVTEVPHAPGFIKGIISLRGAIIPIVDMRLRMGFPNVVATGRERFVVVKKGEGFCGLLVDEVYQVITLAQQPLERPPAVLDGTDRELIKGIGRYGERMFILMDLDKVLDINLN